MKLSTLALLCVSAISIAACGGGGGGGGGTVTEAPKTPVTEIPKTPVTEVPEPKEPEVKEPEVYEADYSNLSMNSRFDFNNCGAGTCDASLTTTANSHQIEERGPIDLNDFELLNSESLIDGTTTKPKSYSSTAAASGDKFYNAGAYFHNDKAYSYFGVSDLNNFYYVMGEPFNPKRPSIAPSQSTAWSWTNVPYSVSVSGKGVWYDRYDARVYSGGDGTITANRDSGEWNAAFGSDRLIELKGTVDGSDVTGAAVFRHTDGATPIVGGFKGSDGLVEGSNSTAGSFGGSNSNNSMAFGGTWGPGDFAETTQ